MRLLPVIFLLLSIGCTHAEFDLTQPENLRTHIGTKDDAIVRLDPFEYRLRAYDDHLFIQVYNPTDEPIQLIGEQSAVVDPKGQSHRVRSATIAPKSYVK